MRLVIVLCLMVGARSAFGQSLIGGVALDSATSRPVRCICVALLDSAGATRDSTWTRAGGRFQFLVSAPGSYRLRFHSPGLVDVATSAVSLDGENEVARAFRIPIGIDPSLRERLRRGVGSYGTLRPRGRWPTPEFPPALVNSVRTGEVIVLLPIDTLGVIDTASVLPVVVSHPPFLGAVQRALRRTRFEPWSLDGLECILAIQPYQFTSTFAPDAH